MFTAPPLAVSDATSIPPFDVTALDNAPGMLDVARAKAAGAEVTVRFVEADYGITVRLKRRSASQDSRVTAIDTID